MSPITWAYRDYVHPNQSSAGPRLRIDQWTVAWVAAMGEGVSNVFPAILSSDDDERRITEFLAQHDQLIADGWEETATSLSRRFLQKLCGIRPIYATPRIEGNEVIIESGTLSPTENASFVDRRIVRLSSEETARRWHHQWVSEQESTGYVEFLPRERETPPTELLPPDAVLDDTAVRRQKIFEEFYRDKTVVSTRWYLDDSDLVTWQRLRVFQDGSTDVWLHDQVVGFDDEENAVFFIREGHGCDLEQIAQLGKVPKTPPPTERADSPLFPFKHYGGWISDTNSIPGLDDEEP